MFGKSPTTKKESTQDISTQTQAKTQAKTQSFATESQSTSNTLGSFQEFQSSFQSSSEESLTCVIKKKRRNRAECYPNYGFESCLRKRMKLFKNFDENEEVIKTPAPFEISENERSTVNSFKSHLFSSTQPSPAFNQKLSFKNIAIPQFSIIPLPTKAPSPKKNLNFSEKSIPTKLEMKDVKKNTTNLFRTAFVSKFIKVPKKKAVHRRNKCSLLDKITLRGKSKIKVFTSPLSSHKL